MHGWHFVQKGNSTLLLRKKEKERKEQGLDTCQNTKHRRSIDRCGGGDRPKQKTKIKYSTKHEARSTKHKAQSTKHEAYRYREQHITHKLNNTMPPKRVKKVTTQPINVIFGHLKVSSPIVSTSAQWCRLGLYSYNMKHTIIFPTIFLITHNILAYLSLDFQSYSSRINTLYTYLVSNFNHVHATYGRDKNG